MIYKVVASYAAAAGVVHLASLFGAAIAFLMGAPDFMDGPGIPEHVALSMLVLAWGYFRGELK